MERRDALLAMGILGTVAAFEVARHSQPKPPKDFEEAKPVLDETGEAGIAASRGVSELVTLDITYR